MKLLLAACLAAAAAAAPQVNVTLYSESLCPDCEDFVLSDWWSVYNTKGVGYGSAPGDGAGIVHWRQVPYGNARMAANGTITCQHGALECSLNTLQNCAIAHSKGTEWLPFIHCLDSHFNNQEKFAPSCATEVGLDWSALQTCWSGAEGQQLVVEAANVTNALVPAHQFVPWVTLSDAPGAGTYCQEDCSGLLAQVCKAYTGTQPDACKGAVAAAGPKHAKAQLRRKGGKKAAMHKCMREAEAAQV